MVTISSLKVRHGSRTAYNYYNCRCKKCRAGHALRAKQYRARKKEQILTDNPPHGELSTYNNYGCRCEPCREVKKASRKKGGMQ